MTRRHTQIPLVLTGILTTVLTTTLDLQSASAEGAARRDAVRQEQIVKDALQQAVEHGRQGHAEKQVTHAEASLQLAMRGGTDPHAAEAITN